MRAGGDPREGLAQTFALARGAQPRAEPEPVEVALSEVAGSEGSGSEAERGAKRASGLRAAQVVPLVLAAGASSRMGVCKAGLRYGERTALARILDACAQAGLARARVVTGAQPAEVEAAAGDATADFLHNPEWTLGRTRSLQRGLEGLPASALAVLLWPVDVCLPGTEVVGALLQAANALSQSAPGLAEAWACVPSHEQRRGHPLLLGAPLFAQVGALGPDASLRELVRELAARGRLIHVERPEPSVLMNANTPEDLARWGGRLE